MVRNGREYRGGRGGYARDFAGAIDRQMREERAFQGERGAAAEGFGWSRESLPADWPRGYGRGGGEWDPGRWQPSATPTAGDLMTEDPAAVTPESTLEEAARTMRDLDVGIVPVIESRESRRLVGVITDRDITVRALAEGKDGARPVRECMTRQVEACHPDDRVRDVLHVMERERVRRVPIVDHAGSLVGIVAQADLAVDLGAGEEHLKLRVENTIERISEPARPRRGGWY